MSLKWVAVVDRSEARIFDAETMGRIHTLKNSLGREKNRAFTTSKPGSARSRFGARASTHGLTGEKNPHDQVTIQFAKKLNAFLKKRLGEKRFERLILAAEPRMKGWIREGMDRSVNKLCEWKSKDFAHFSDHELKAIFLKKKKVS